MAEAIKILYIGKDGSFWRELQSKTRNMYRKLQFEFEQRYGNGPEVYGKTFIHICENPPNVIYVDFAVDPIDCLYLAKLILRENSLKHIPIVGLLDYLASEDQVLKSIFTGIPFVHIKGGDFFSKVYDPLFLAAPDDITAPKFATAKAEEAFDIYEIFRLGYVSNENIHFEGDSHFEVGEFVHLDQKVFDSSTLPSNRFRVTHVSRENLYYDYRYAYEAEFVFKDPEVDEEGKAKAENAELKALKEEISGRIGAWVKENSQGENSKSTKVFIVDRNNNIYLQVKEKLEKMPYSFRTQTYIKNIEGELRKHMPHIICYRIEEKSDYDKKREEYKMAQEELLKNKEITAIQELPEREQFNSFKNLKTIVEVINSIDKYDPFIVIFGESRRNSETCKQELGYKKVIALKNEIDFKLIVNLADKFSLKAKEQDNAEYVERLNMLKKQNYNRYARTTIEDLKPKKVFFKKSDKRSWMLFHHKVILKEINEAEIYIQSDRELPLYTSFKIDDPVHYYITIVPHIKNNLWEKEQGVYRGLIHVITETEKAKLRQHINTYFFKEKDEKKRAELEEWKAKNEAVVAERASLEKELEEGQEQESVEKSEANDFEQLDNDSNESEDS